MRVGKTLEMKSGDLVLDRGIRSPNRHGDRKRAGRSGDDWTIERLARTAAMSRATFLRHFSQGTGMTVGAFVACARVMAAAELLGSSDATLATIAGQVGYQSESAFSRAFRSEVGMTPAGFRRDQRRQAVR